MQFYPRVPAEVSLTISHYPNSDPALKQTFKRTGRANRFGYFSLAGDPISLATPGEYRVDLTYAGEGRLVWRVSVNGGDSIQNQQNASHNYQRFPIGWLRFPKPGRYQVNVSCTEGDTQTASLKAIRFTPIP